MQRTTNNFHAQSALLPNSVIEYYRDENKEMSEEQTSIALAVNDISQVQPMKNKIEDMLSALSSALPSTSYQEIFCQKRLFSYPSDNGKVTNYELILKGFPFSKSLEILINLLRRIMPSEYQANLYLRNYQQNLQAPTSFLALSIKFTDASVILASEEFGLSEVYYPTNNNIFQIDTETILRAIENKIAMEYPVSIEQIIDPLFSDPLTNTPAEQHDFYQGALLSNFGHFSFVEPNAWTQSPRSTFK